tara:strand:- start:113 stop:310 length:198 start_codon:yes stop_codon:yes gene_type:complete
MTTYKVHIEGGMLIEKDVIFTSLKEAKKYMKEQYPIAVKWGATLFTLTNEEECISINTRTTIVNL